MDIFSFLAEQKINQALADGVELNSPRWKNRALPLADDQVPADLRIAYTMLKNSGFTPPELETRKEIHRLQDLLASSCDEAERLRQMQKLNVLMQKLDNERSKPCSFASQDAYYQKIIERISVSRSTRQQNGG